MYDWSFHNTLKKNHQMLDLKIKLKAFSDIAHMKNWKSQYLQ